MNNRLYHKIKEYVSEYNMFDDCGALIVGVSGGIDSTCLLSILCEMRAEFGFTVAAVHVNHMIRGEEADKDEQFVRKLCDDNNVKLMVVKEDVKALAKEMKLTIEEAGRKVRYDAFNTLAGNFRQTGIKAKIAVAHNMDDNAETVLFNMFRGSGLRGLCGIRPVNKDIVRPLLCAARTEIMEYLEDRNISYRMDSSNLTCDYTRNVTRLMLMPVITDKINCKALSHINEASVFIRQAQDYMDKMAGEEYDRLVSIGNNSALVCREELLRLDEVIGKLVLRKMIESVAGALKDIEYVHVADCMKLARAATGKRIDLPYDMVAETEYDNLRIRKKEINTQNSTNETINLSESIEKLKMEEKMEVSVKNGTFSICLSSKKSEIEWNNDYTKCFDYDKIKGDVVIRTRRNGDYLVINKDGSRKKLKDYFIDNKIPKNLRDKIVLVASGSEILWIPGYRGSESCHVTEETVRVLLMSFEDNTKGN